MNPVGLSDLVMAFIGTFTCTVCLQERMEVVDRRYPEICEECRVTGAKAERVGILLGLRELTIEQRLAKIEAWIYDYRPPQSIHDVKFG